MDVTVVGSVNLDLVARVERLPRAGETLTAHGVTRLPGGKGANQALAAARLGARVRLVGAVGDDPLADEALALLRSGGVDLTDLAVVADLPTGTALISVDDEGDTTIVIDAGANAALGTGAAGSGPGGLPSLAGADVVLTVLEVPDAAVAAAMEAPGFTVLNAAPARAVAASVLSGVDLLSVNEDEAAVLGREADLDAVAALAVTHGADGAELRRLGRVVARARPPAVEVVDGTAAGDTFTAALALALAGGTDDETALHRACTAGALAATRAGAQPSLPTLAELTEALA